jgi:hypothetical protein
MLDLITVYIESPVVFHRPLMFECLFGILVQTLYHFANCILS